MRAVLVLLFLHNTSLLPRAVRAPRLPDPRPDSHVRDCTCIEESGQNAANDPGCALVSLTATAVVPAADQQPLLEPSEIDMDDDDELLMDLSHDDLDALPASMAVDMSM